MSDAPHTNGLSLSLNDDPLLNNSNPTHDEDSPTTPVSNITTASDLKIDMDIQEPESDARHEPLPIKIDKLDHASVLPELGTPLDPGAWCRSSSSPSCSPFSRSFHCDRPPKGVGLVLFPRCGSNGKTRQLDLFNAPNTHQHSE